MSNSRAVIKTVSSVNLVFGLDWFAILGGTAVREVRRIARQQKATHAVYAGDDAASAGVGTVPAVKRRVLYSAAQLVAHRFSSGVVALIVPLDDQQWWLVAVHEGAVIARTDHIFASLQEAAALITQLRQSYPSLVLLDDDASGAPSLPELVATLPAEAELRRVVYSTRFVTRPVLWLVLFMVVGFLISRADALRDYSSRYRLAHEPQISPEQVWNEAMHRALDAHWVHGVTGTADVLLSLYDLPVALNGWRLQRAECVSSLSLWQCHADYDRADREASNAGLLAAAPPSWDISFTPLEQARAAWHFASSGLSLAQSAPGSRRHTERHVFSNLQAIRPALASVHIEAAQPLRIPAPVDAQGLVIPPPPGQPTLHMRTVRIQAPLRSLSVLLPHCRDLAWQRVVLALDPPGQPDLAHSRLNVTLHGVLYEQD